MTPGTTIPAALVGVWEGAQVVVRSAGHDQHQRLRGVVVGPHWGEWGVWLAREGDLPATMIAARQSGLLLDLTHRPTRLEVMARLGARVGADVSEGVLWFRMFARRTWMLDGNGGQPGTWAPEEDGDASIVLALADFDPTDDTRLPDGARVVDVQALAIVLRQVFGVAR